jgi:hypothetical protein
MKKIVLSLTCLAMMSSNAFALEIYKGNLIKHKEWTDGTAKMIVNSGKMFPAKLNSSFPWSLQSSLEHQKGKVGELNNIKAEHQVNVVNRTDKKQRYVYQFSVCSGEEKTFQCAYYLDEFELEPGGNASGSKEPVLQKIFKAPGQYDTEAMSSLGVTAVDGSSYRNINSWSFGTIEIS